MLSLKLFIIAVVLIGLSSVSVNSLVEEEVRRKSDQVAHYDMSPDTIKNVKSFWCVVFGAGLATLLSAIIAL